MIASFDTLGRAEIAALIVQTLASHGIDVVLVGGSCVCLWTSERFGSLDLDFIDVSYTRRKEIAAALDTIGFKPQGNTKYFEHPESKWSVEFPTGPLAIGREQIQAEKIATLDTSLGIIRLLNPTDTIKDRLLWWYLDGDRQCWEQALDIARNHRVSWADLETWHTGEDYADRYLEFRTAV